jgi:pimeloyl-ACP methyl ester carboxylesterase
MLVVWQGRPVAMEEEASMSDTVQSADGTTIAYERTGSGPALIVVGGALSNRQAAGWLAPSLGGHFTVYAFDRRGRGDSTDTPPYAVEREIEDLAGLVAAAGGTAFVYGHSSGAVLALEATARGLPVTRLAVYEPPYMVDDTREKPAPDFASRVQAAVDAGRVDVGIETFLREAVLMPDEVFAMTQQSPMWPGMLAVGHTLPYDIAIVGDGSIPTARFAMIAAPTLVMDGGASPAWIRNAAATAAAAIPGAQRLTVEGQDHAVAPDVLAPLLIDFFGD